MDITALLDQGHAALAAGGRLDQAEQCFEGALAAAPSAPAALVGWAVVRRARGFADEAEGALRRVLAQDPCHADGWAQLGTSLRVLNRLRPSGQALERALLLAPDHSYARQNLTLLEQMWRRGEIIQIDYPPAPKVRHGYGRPPHDRLAKLLSAETDNYHPYARTLAAIAADLAAIPRAADPARPQHPWWDSIWFPPLDAAVLCAMIAHHRPRLLVEIGSGMSTRFARWTIDRFATGTRLESIDPEPRADIDALCDHVVRCRLEDADHAVLPGLRAGDILFFDGSHRSFQNSDVTVFFTEILPELASGVIVHIHDIFLPYDYPPHWLNRFYNEQYVLAAMLLAGQERYRVLWPGAFVADLVPVDAALPAMLRGGRGGSFWMSVV